MYDQVAEKIASCLKGLTPEAPWGAEQGAVSAFKPLGFEGATFVHIGHPVRGLSPRPVFGRPISPAWIKSYRDKGLERRDVMVPMILRSDVAFTWSEAEAQAASAEDRELFATCRQFSPDMLVCPVPAGDGAMGCVNLWMDSARALGEFERAMAQSLATLYATLGQSRMGARAKASAPERVALSKRELECVYWVANGKSDTEIAAVLGLSASTVHHHVEKAKRKLAARSRIELINKASELGLVLRPLHP